jgi:sigma-B regulation protein RsbU (phosphoserine phosphatase)
MQQGKEIGSSFYDFFLVDQDHLAIVIADVSGKGIPAALFMVVAKTLIKDQTQAGYSPAEVFSLVNTQLCRDNNTGMFVTAWIGILQISTGKFTYANAGHNPPLLKKNNNCYKFLSTPSGFILAGKENTKYRQFEIELEQGDMLYLYTKGVIKVTNLRNTPFGEERLLATLNKNSNAAPGELLIEVREAVADFKKEAPQLDDITMLALQINNPSDNVQGA